MTPEKVDNRLKRELIECGVEVPSGRILPDLTPSMLRVLLEAAEMRIDLHEIFTGEDYNSQTTSNLYAIYLDLIDRRR